MRIPLVVVVYNVGCTDVIKLSSFVIDSLTNWKSHLKSALLAFNPVWYVCWLVVYACVCNMRVLVCE